MNWLSTWGKTTGESHVNHETNQVLVDYCTGSQCELIQRRNTQSSTSMMERDRTWSTGKDIGPFHGISWYFMVFHGISWYFMVFHGISWYFMVHANHNHPSILTQCTTCLCFPQNDTNLRLCQSYTKNPNILVIPLKNPGSKVLFCWCKNPRVRPIDYRRCSCARRCNCCPTIRAPRSWNASSSQQRLGTFP